MGCEERFKSQEPKQLKLERQLFYRGHQWGSKRWKIQKDVEKKVCVGVTTAGNIITTLLYMF